MPEVTNSSVVTIQQLIDTVESLKPERVLQFRNIDSEFSCSTGVIYNIEIAGRRYPLTERAGRIGAGYVRVSTEGQRQDGFSAEDQVFRIASYFAERGEAFQIFSDAGISGTVPINDPVLIQRVWNKKASLYKELFERVFLTNTENKYSATDRALMRLFVDDAYERIRAGEDVDDVLAKADATDSPGLDESPTNESVDAPKAMNRKNVNQKRLYRPGLTLISDTLTSFHTIAITDLSRLSRSQLTFGELHDKFSNAKVEVVGLVESLAWMNDREQRNEVGSQIQALLLPMFAEHKVREATLGVLRAIATRFDNRQPHGLIPTWLKRKADGTVEWGDPKFVEAIREMVRLYRVEKLGFGTIASILTEKGFRTKRGKPYPIVTVAYILNSRSLCGQQVMFGRPWDVFPAFLSVEEFEEMQEYRTKRNQDSGIRGRPAGERYLLADRFRCPCGRSLKHRTMSAGGAAGEPYRFWSCRSTASEKRVMEYQGTHPTMPDTEIQRFFGELLGRYGHIVVDESRSSREETKAKTELHEVKERLRATEAEYAATRRSATSAAEQQAKNDGIDDDNPFFAQYVQIRVAALTNRLREEVGALKQRESSLTDVLAQLSAQKQTGGITAQMSRWDTLSAIEKNDIVKEVFRVVQFTGTAPNETLELELANAPAGSLPPVSVIATLAARGGSYARRLPSVQQWLEGAFAGEGFDVVAKPNVDIVAQGEAGI